MKSLKESLLESLAGVKTTKLSGTHAVKCSSKENSVDVDAKSTGWHKSELTKAKVVAFWANDVDWIFYHPVDKPDEWAAVSPGDIKPADFSDAMFKDFDKLRADGATIPEFDSFEADLA